MRAHLTIYDDSGKSVQEMEGDWNDEHGARLGNPGDERVARKQKRVAGRRLIGVRVTPFYDVTDSRATDEIERANSEGGFGRQRGEAMGVPHGEG